MNSTTVPRSSQLPNPNNRLAYVVVHADEYAIRVSRLVEHPPDFQERLCHHLLWLVSQRAHVFLLNLNKNELHPPSFLQPLNGRVVVVPSLDQDQVNDQAQRLREQLVRYPKIQNVVFTGGWKNACLKHTLNQTIRPKGTERVRMVDDIDQPFPGVVEWEGQRLEVMVMMDHQFVF